MFFFPQLQHYTRGQQQYPDRLWHPNYGWVGFKELKIGQENILHFITPPAAAFTQGRPGPLIHAVDTKIVTLQSEDSAEIKIKQSCNGVCACCSFHSKYWLSEIL